MAQTKTNRSEAGGRHSITLFPNEIRGIIFNKLKQTEIYKLRLVCKQGNQDVKDWYNFSITLNEDSPGLEFILQLRIAELRVKKLVQKRMRILPLPTTAPATQDLQLRSRTVQRQQEMSLTFKHPNRLRQILITESSNMSANDLKELLQLSQKNVTHVHLSLDYPNYEMLKHEFPSPLSFHFPNLKHLDLSRDGMSTSGLYFKTYLLERNTILALLENSQFPSLKYLHVRLQNKDCMDGAKPDSARAIGFVLKLLSKNPKGLERFSIELNGFERDKNNSCLGNFTNISEPERSNLKTATDLKHLRFSLTKISASINKDILLNLIPLQRRLEKFYADEGVECSPPFLRSIILNNFETLVDVYVDSLHVNSAEPFDIAILENCLHLKRFSLLKNERNSVPSVGSGPEVINCGSFPAGMIYLVLSEVRILSRDLLALVSSVLLTTLRELILWNCGHSGDCGINFAVLEKFVGLKAHNLNFADFYKLNYSGPKKEVAEMKEIMWSMGSTTSRLSLERDDNPDLPNDGLVQDLFEARVGIKIGEAWRCRAFCHKYHDSDDDSSDDDSSAE